MDQKTLIDRAAHVCGGQNKLALAIGAASGTVSEWRNGKRPCPVAYVALMAELIGATNVAEVVGEVELARAGNPQLKRSRGVVAMLALFGASVAALGAAGTDQLMTMYRTVNLRRPGGN